MRIPVLAAAVVLLGSFAGGGVAAAAPDRTPGGTPDRTQPRVAWGSCGKGLGAFDCARVQVPTDYDHPRGATTTIALTRLPATDPAHRIGSLFTNFGGPGEPGTLDVQALGKTLFDPRVRQRYDVVGFDPRGVGASDPVTCYPTKARETAALARIAAFPVTPAQERRYTRQARDLAHSCARTSGARIAHASTANVARDLDRLRAAVGDRRLHYVGYSYGTYLGATYGRLFPGRVGRFVLDGTVDPKAWAGRRAGPDRTWGMRIGQGPAAEDTFAQFQRLCAQAGAKRCPLAGLGAPHRVVRATLDRLQRRPVPVRVPDGTTVRVTYDKAVQSVSRHLYEPATWSELGDLLAYLADPEGASRAVARSAGKAVAEIPPGPSLGHGADYLSIGNLLAPNCVDANYPTRPAQYPALADRADRAAPDLGRMRAWLGLQCEFLGIADHDRYVGPWRQQSRVPVLVVGTVHDPATPYVNTRPYADLWPRGRMLTVHGYGHTTIGKSACADRRIAAYLLHGTARDGATCAQSVVPFGPAPRAARGTHDTTSTRGARWHASW